MRGLVGTCQGHCPRACGSQVSFTDCASLGFALRGFVDNLTYIGLIFFPVGFGCGGCVVLAKAFVLELVAG